MPETPLWACRVGRDVLRVRGADAVSYLHGQVSQDISAIAVGESRWSFVLQPTGMVDAWVRVSRVGEDELLVDVDGGAGPAVRARLEKFKIRVKVDIEQLDWQCVAVRGAGADAVAAPEGGIAAPAQWPGATGVDLLGPEVAVPTGAVTVGTDVYEAARIAAAVPAMGRELTESTIPAETGVVERSVSFTKGCYTGQELVERIDSRGGHVAKRLVRLRLAAGVEPGAELIQGERAVGTVTSVAVSSGAFTIGLGYVSRNADAGEPLVAVSGRDEHPAEIVDRPSKS